MNLKKFIHSLQFRCEIKPEDVIIVGVSGGSDSTCLLDLLHRAGNKIIVANFNHRLRNEADADSAHVERLTQDSGIEYVQGSGDVRGFAKNNQTSIEDAARTLRYKFLFKVANQYMAQVVAVGHTSDDQVETILMHQLRGCGLDGLQGMLFRSITEFNSKIPLIRPLLEFSRNDLLKYCQENCLTYLEDRSNQEKTFLRNRIRLEMIPYLEQYNPGIKKNILKMAHIIQGDVEILTQKTKEEFQKCLIAESDNFFQISTTMYKNMPEGMQRRVIIYSLKKLQSDYEEIDFQMVENILQFITGPTTTKHLHLFSDIEVMLENDSLFFYQSDTEIPTDDWPQMVVKGTLNLNIPGSQLIHPNWCISCTVLTQPPNVKMWGRGFMTQAYVDLEELEASLTIRTQRTGDRYELLGLDGESQKLTDFWINKKIPRRLRSKWPLVLSGKKLAWIPGFAPAHFCKIQPATKKIACIEFVKNQ